MSSPDIVLLSRWQRHRDADAFAEIVSRYSGLVYATCRRVLRSAADAEDAAQDCFVELMQSGRPIRASLGGWLHTMALHRSLDRLKGEKRRHDRERAFATTQAVDLAVPQDDVLSRIDEAIAALPDDLREVVVARFLEGCTHQAIGHTCGVAESTVRYRVEKGVECVRAFLKRRGVAASGMALTGAMADRLAEAAPATLVASLGKLALTGGAATANSAVPAFVWGMLKWMQELAGIKTAVLAVAVIAVTVVGVWHGQSQRQGAGVTREVSSAIPASKLLSLPPDSTRPGAEGTVPSAPRPQAGAASASTPADGGVVTGRIYDSKTGKGIEGISLRAFPSGGGRLVGKVEKSDGTGQYRISELPQGSITVQPESVKEYPRKPLGGTLTVTIADPPVVEGVDFALDRGVRVAGAVVALEGTPIPGAGVVAKTREMANPERTQTGSDGMFDLFLPSRSEGLLIQAQTDDFVSIPDDSLSLPESGVDALVLRLTEPRTASIAGLVVDAAGHPVLGAQVHLRPSKDGGVAPGGVAKCGGDGTFRIERLPAGTYGVIITPPGVSGYRTDMEQGRFELARNQSLVGVRLVFGEKGGLAIAGRVVDSSGKPVANAVISCMGPASGTAHSSADGGFTLTGLEEGDYSVMANCEGFTMTSAGGIRTGVTDLKLVLRGMATIKGRVLRADTGNPLTEFEVSYINGTAEKFAPALLGNIRKMKNVEGRFRFENVYVDDVTVTAQAPGFAPKFTVLSLKEHETAGNIELRLEPAKPFVRKVTNIKGEPVPDAYIFLGGALDISDIQRVAIARTSADGAFTLDSLSPDIEVVGAWHPDYAPGVLHIPKDNAIVLPQAGAVEGTVLGGEEPIPDVMVYARYPDEPSLPSAYTKSGADGTFRITGLPPGRVRIQAALDGLRRTASCEGVLASGEAIETRPTFRSGSSAVEGRVTVCGAVPEIAALTLSVQTSTGECAFRLTAASDGSFRFQEVPSGSARLDVHTTTHAHPSRTKRETVEFDLREGENVRKEVEVP